MFLTNRRELRRLVRQNRLTHRDLAALVGWSTHSYVGRLLRGEVHTLSDAAAESMADLFGVPVSHLFAPAPSKILRHDVDQESAA